MQPSKSMQVSEYSNSLILDMKSLANVLKPISKNLYEVIALSYRIIIECLISYFLLNNNKYTQPLLVSLYTHYNLRNINP